MSVRDLRGFQVKSSWLTLCFLAVLSEIMQDWSPISRRHFREEVLNDRAWDPIHSGFAAGDWGANRAGVWDLVAGCLGTNSLESPLLEEVPRPSDFLVSARSTWMVLY